MLIVDDDGDYRVSIARILAAHDFTCLEAANGAEARAVLDRAQDVEAVLCDITLPGESGIELLKDLTADHPELVVVMTTASDNPSVAETAFELGAFGYVIKPFEPNELLITLSSALRRGRLESARRDQMHGLEDTIARNRILGGVFDEIESEHEPVLEADGDAMERLSRALSLRDEETGRHIERMSRYAVVLAEAVGFTSRPLEDLRVATALHDVGKIGVPDGILLKPGTLAPDEYRVMQRHAQMGYQLLAGSSSEILAVAADIALSHHEWWDGGGYPSGMQGEEISEEARIAAIADVFDALTSNRVYRPAMSFDDAMAIMGDLRGRQFEPRLLDAFFASMDEIAAIREAFPDVADAQKRIRVLVVDDQEIFAHSLVRLLGSRPELKVVGRAATVAEAVTAAIAYQSDVIVMDYELPDGDGAEATERIKALVPGAKVIMLTARRDDPVLVRAIGVGCSGFLRKEDTVDSLLAAIFAAHEGETFVPPTELAPLLRQLRPTNRGLGSDLTRRELEVLGLIASGLVNKEIALRLGLRLNTVRHHVQNTLAKLQAHSKLEAVATAVREGVIDYPST